MSLVDDAVAEIKTLTPDQVIEVVRTYGEPQLEKLLDGLCGCGGLVTAPLDALLRLAEGVAKAIEAKNEKSAMAAAVQATDATLDAAEEEALKAPRWP
jgi:hypothetical protein